MFKIPEPSFENEDTAIKFLKLPKEWQEKVWTKSFCDKETFISMDIVDKAFNDYREYLELQVRCIESGAQARAARVALFQHSQSASQIAWIEEQERFKTTFEYARIQQIFKPIESLYGE